MDINDLRSAVTLVSFAIFAVIVWRAWRPSRRDELAQAALLPFQDEGETR
jgi:cbb3-type cytochrome oxidase subunit 3